MEDYYNANYQNHKVATIDDFINEKVWNVIYDESNDLVYVFVAKI